MRFGSVCSGIEAASVAFTPLGWKAAWLAEIEPFPSAVLAAHYPDVRNLGDMMGIAEMVDDGEVEAPDLLCGGCPCQSFSVAGLRNSLSDARGNLTLEFIRIADAIDRVRRNSGRPPAWVFYENVPGILNTRDNAFGAFLGGLCGDDVAIMAPPDGWPRAGVVAGPTRVVAWRVLDAQFFGLAQRRQRVFVLALGGAGKWACADALLPIGHSLQGHPAPRRQAGQRPTGTLSARTDGGGGLGTDFECDGGLIPAPHAAISPALKARDHKGVSGDGDGDGAILVPMLAHALRGEGFDASEDGTGRGTPLVPVAYRTAGDGAVYHEGSVTAPLTTGTDSSANVIAFSSKDHGADAMLDCSPTLRAGGHATSHANAGVMPAIAFQERGRADGPNLEIGGDIAFALTAPKGGGRAQERNVLTPTMSVRRLTERECERLQGFSDGHTDVPYRGKPAAGGPRYKAIGNSWAVPVVAWIGRRIDAVEAIRQTNSATQAVAETEF